MRTQRINYQRMLDSLSIVRLSTSYNAPQENAQAAFNVGNLFKIPNPIKAIPTYDGNKKKTFCVDQHSDEDGLAAFLAGLKEPYFGYAQAACPEDLEAAQRAEAQVRQARVKEGEERKKRTKKWAPLFF